MLGGSDKDLDPCLIEIPEELGTRDRKRRTLSTVAPPPAATQDAEKKPKKNKSTVTAVVSSSKENTQNHRKPSTTKKKKAHTASVLEQVEKQKVVKARRRRSIKDKKKDSLVDDKHKWPADLPLEITVHSRPAFASPMNEKGAEDKRKYMYGGAGAAVAHLRSSPSTGYYAGSGVARCRDENDDEDNDYLSDSNSQPVSMQEDDDESEASSPEAAAKGRMSLDQTGPAGLIQRVTLQSVVDREMKEAENFVQDVLHRKPEATEAKKTKPAAPKASPRQEELMAVFLSLMEHNEGTAEEDCLAEQLNQQSRGTKDFTVEEVRTLMDSLAVSNKIMRCDGSIYWL